MRTLLIVLMAVAASLSAPAQIRQGQIRQQVRLRNFTITPPAGSTATTFTLTGKPSSAGIYDATGVLVRTLWSNQKRAGTYATSELWDGTDDAGNYVADGSYELKVVDSDVQYTWLKPIGNTSDTASGSTIHHAAQLITNMVQVGTDMYLSNGYNEALPVHTKFKIGKPGTLTTTLKPSGLTGRFVTSDGTKVYFAGQWSGTGSFVSALTPNPTGADALVSFSSGSPVQSHNSLYSAFDIDDTGNYVTGLTVQTSGNYLFSAHTNLGQVRVFNKNTGASVRTLNMLSPRSLAMQADALWISQYTPHTGSTTASKLSGTPFGSMSTDNPALAFDGLATVYKNAGGPVNHVGLSFSSRVIVTKIRLQLEAGSSANAKLVGANGQENYLLADVSQSGNSFVDYTVTNANPVTQIKLLSNTDANLRVQEIEVYGYTYSGNPVVSRHTVNSDGTISAATLSITGLTDPLDIAVSPDGTRLAVADRGTYHQVKLYSTSSGNLIQTLGRSETYSDPTVYDDKFYFANTRIFLEDDFGTAHAFVQFQTDNSLWVGDYGNMRCQHFSASGAYVDNIQYQGYSYSAQADPNAPTRVFCDFLEFAVNYSDNSWSYVRNWSKNIYHTSVYDQDRMRSVTTLSNGRTYCLFKGPQNGKEVLELVAGSGIRHTGIYLENANCDLYTDGSVWQIGDNSVGNPTFWKRKALTGFDGAGNPQWGSYVTVETTPAVALSDPLNADGYLRRQHQTSTGVVATFSFDNGRYERGRGYHLGGVKGGKWLFRVSPATRTDYYGDYPSDGAFDIGNQVNNPADWMQAVDRNIFWGYIGEFWKQAQTNTYNHYLDNGLMVGQFGITGDVARIQGESSPMMAGNIKSGTYVKVGSDIHLFHCDENAHAAVHHWRISNLSSIQERSFPLVKAGIPSLPALNYVSLMNSIPVSGTVGAGSRWSTTTPFYFNQEFDQWQLLAGVTTYGRDTRSVRLSSYPTASGLTREAFCDLKLAPGVANNLTSWSLTAGLIYPIIDEPDDNWLDVLDNTGKVLVRLSRSPSGLTITLSANGQPLVTGRSDGLMKLLFQNKRPLSIKRSGTNLLVSYAGYSATVSALESGANLSAPDKLRVHFYSSNNASHSIDLTDLQLYPQ